MCVCCRDGSLSLVVYIPQRGVQWKQGVVVYIILKAVLLYNTTQIHCAPLPLHPPVTNTQVARQPPIHVRRVR